MRGERREIQPGQCAEQRVAVSEQLSVIHREEVGEDPGEEESCDDQAEDGMPALQAVIAGFFSETQEVETSMS